jgi:hypothetical protein
MPALRLSGYLSLAQLETDAAAGAATAALVAIAGNVETPAFVLCYCLEQGSHCLLRAGRCTHGVRGMGRCPMYKLTFGEPFQ